MAPAGGAEPSRVAGVIRRYGSCVELVPVDPHFHHITVALYVKDGTCTVWTFSQKPGAQDRVEQVRDQLVAQGGLMPVEGTHNQVRFPCGYFHRRAVKFLMARAVNWKPGQPPAEGPLSIVDTRSALTLIVEGRPEKAGWVYQVSGEGEAPNLPARLRMVAAGFVRYGEMEKAGDTEVTFPCGRRHDELVRLLLPYSRNVTAVENMMEAEAQRGQMTTGTLGFSPT
jgi:hypothetical protein